MKSEGGILVEITPYEVKKMKSKLLIFLGLYVLTIIPIMSSTTRIALSSAPSNLSPFFSTDANSQNINRLIHLSLTDFSENMEFECRFCESYSEKVVKGKHHIRFKLKRDQKFWDGSNVLAGDVKNSWKYFIDEKKIKSVFRFTFSAIEDVIIINDYEVELVFKSFSLSNLSDLALLKIIKIKEKSKNKSALKEDDFIGAGKYQLKKVTPLQIELEPIDKTKSFLVFKVVKDETTLTLKLINQEIDLSLASISPRKYFWLKEKNVKGVKFWERTSSTYNYMGLNHRREILKDLRVRKALSLLIPREKILKYKLKNTAVLSSSMFSPAFEGLHLGDLYDRENQKEAMKLLKQVGFQKNSSGKLEKNGKIFSLTWKVSNNKATLEVVQTLKSYFEKAGIIINVVIQEWGTFFRGIKKGNFDIMVGRWIGFTGPDILKYIFHSESLPPKGANRGGYINRALDDLINNATIEIDTKKRNNLYKKAIQIVNQDYAYINLWHPNIIWVGRDCLNNIELHPNGSFYPLLEMVNKCGK